MVEAYTEKQKKSYEALKEKFGYKNPMAVPHIEKIVVSAGTGRGVKADKNRNTLVTDRLMKITGQKGSLRQAKKSISTFKLRMGEPIGVMVTLRGARMKHFFDKLVHIALPRTKDFRGISKGAVDEVGNLTIGVREHTIFPETPDEELRDVFGLAITIVTTAKDKEEALAYFDYLGIPFKKDDGSKKGRGRRKKGKK